MSNGDNFETAYDLTKDAHIILSQIIKDALYAPQYDAFVFSDDGIYTNVDFRECFEQQVKFFRENPGTRRCAIFGEKNLRSYATICAAIQERITFCIIDPQFPTARREEIIRSFGPSIFVKDDTAELGLEVGKSSTDLGEAEIAYVMFTSGTTGSPKGVRISYQNLLAFLDGALQKIDITKGARWANHASLSFDLSMFDLLGSLKVGATLYPLIEKTDKLFPGRFIERNKITVWHSTPTIVRYLVAERAEVGGRLVSLNAVLMCGEPLRTEWVNYLLKNCAPTASVYNCYGPTETTVFCTVDKFCDPNDARLVGVSAPIGSPLPGVSVEYDLVAEDEYEIVIRGTTVGPGYDSAAQETAQGYGHDEKGKFFRTGDFVELSEGEAYFKRRGDRQVKLRGNRFELAEAESVLNMNSCFDCVLCIHDDSLFLFAGPGCKCSDTKLLEVCSSHLPDFAQPRRIIHVELWPISMNGKLDTNGLLELITNGN